VKLEIIDLHTVAVDLLSPGGWTLDAGARGFEFSRAMAAKGQKVIALDPAPDIVDPQIDGVTFLRQAIAGSTLTGIGSLKAVSDPQASWVHVDYAPSPKAGKDVVMVNILTLRDLMERFKISIWDCIKLNIEGAEYEILDKLTAPVAKQIVVSFHEHTGRGYGRKSCDIILDRLARWYDIHQRVWEPRYGCHSNYWDLLLTLGGIG